MASWVIFTGSWPDRRSNVALSRRARGRLSVGLGMIPRGEVGLIFAGVGMTLVLHKHPVVTPALFSGVVIMVMVTTLVTPPLLKWRLGTAPDEAGTVESAEDAH